MIGRDGVGDSWRANRGKCGSSFVALSSFSQIRLYGIFRWAV